MSKKEIFKLQAFHKRSNFLLYFIQVWHHEYLYKFDEFKSIDYIPKMNALKLSLQSNKIEKNIAMDFNEIIYLCVPGKETDQITINKINW